MKFLAVAYPKIIDADQVWIQSIRRQYDPQFEIVEPHFTIIFPTITQKIAAFRKHIRDQVANFSSFPFVIRCALPVKDVLSPSTHIFLVPDEGLSQFVRLHDTCYETLLASDLLLEVPYIPHITVGASNDPKRAKAICDTINQQRRTISGTITAVTI